MPALRPLVPLLFSVWSLCHAAPARAAQEGELELGLFPTYAFVLIEQDVKPDGGGVGAYLHYGLTDAFAVRLTGMWTGHDLAPTEEKQGGLFQVFNAAVGLAYGLDVTGRVRGSLEGGVGVLHQRFADQVGTSLELHLGVALDYRALPWLALGVAFHYHAYLASPSQYPVYFDLGPRVALVL